MLRIAESLSDAGFSVTGTVNESAGKQLILNQFTSQATIALDTIVLTEKGDFNFKASTAAPELYSIQLEGEQAHILLSMELSVLQPVKYPLQSVRRIFFSFQNIYDIRGKRFIL